MMSQQNQQWFVAERARALALVHLTRRDDLVVKKAEEGVGLEFMVYIHKQSGESSVRPFGVFLRVTKSPVIEAQLAKVLQPTMQSFRRVGPFPYPVCLFHFSMDDDQGYYTWVAEPVIAEGQPRLLLHESARCRKLDEAALGEIVAEVDRWYDAFFARIAVKAS
jgi:hypothetical protein